MTHRRTRRGAAVAVLLLTSPAWTAPPADRSSNPPIELPRGIVTEHELAVGSAAANASRSLDEKPTDDMPSASPDVESEAAEASDAPDAGPTEEAVPARLSNTIYLQYPHSNRRPGPHHKDETTPTEYPPDAAHSMSKP